MTAEQIYNYKILALETAKWVNKDALPLTIDDLKKEAEVIFQWLMSSN